MERASAIRREVSQQLRKVLEERGVTTVFQPIFGFREGRVLGFEALVRGPQGSLLESPAELFAAAAEAGASVELNVVCIQETLRAFGRRKLGGSLFLNVSPQLIMERGFNRERGERFLAELGLNPGQVVIELTEDYPTVDFRLVHESLMLYRSMGFRVAIDDLGEGFASLRLWSELRPEFVKADKHFVTGVACDPVKAQFLRAIQNIAESAGSQVIAEGIENAADFKVVKDLGVACGQGWFIGRPSAAPAAELSEEAQRAQADGRVPVFPATRLKAGSEPVAHDFVRAVEAAKPQATLGAVLRRFASSAQLCAIPLAGASGVEGVVSRAWLDLVAVSGEAAKLRQRPCVEFADRSPIRVEADLGLAALAALLAESDARRLADGFVIVSRGRYLGMGRSADVMHSLQNSRVLAARYTNPLTLLPGQVPINEHLEKLLAGRVPFTAWFAEVDQLRGLNDCEGFLRGDALIHATARLLESECVEGIDFAGHVSGSRFVVLMQSEDWQARAEDALAKFAPLVEGHVRPGAIERGYFAVSSRDGHESVRPLPKLGIGILPVLPGVFESRHEVVAAAKHAAQKALARTSSAIEVDRERANAYPPSLLLG